MSTQISQGGHAGLATRILRDRRIVYAYDMYVDHAKLSVSLATVEIPPEGRGACLRFTEQAVFLDGYDDAGSRERGTGGLLDALGKTLGQATAQA